MSFRTPSPLGLRLRAQSRPIIFATALSFGAVLLSFPVRAGEHSHTMAGDAMPPGMMMMSPPPVGVPGASMPAPGKTVAMFTNRWLHLDGTKAGTKDVSPEWVVLNGFNPNRPPVQYRRVPTSATIHVQGFGLTHGLTPWLSVNVAGAYITKATRVTTFRGPAGTSVLGQRTDSTEGFGDTALGAAVRRPGSSQQGSRPAGGARLSYLAVGPHPGGLTAHVDVPLVRRTSRRGRSDGSRALAVGLHGCWFCCADRHQSPAGHV